MIKAITLILCYFLFGLLHLSGQIMADSIPQELSLVNNKEVTVLQSDLNTSFKEIKQQTGWKPYDSTHTSSTKTATWLRFKIENRSVDTVQTYLYSNHHYATTYQQERNSFKILKNGSYVPLSQRANKTEYFFTKLTFLPFQKSDVYIRLKVDNLIAPASFPTIFSQKGYWESSRNNYKDETNSIGFIYFYIVSLLSIFVFALVFWIRLREKLYLHYLGYLLFQLIYGFITLRSTVAPIGNYFVYFPKLSNDLMEPVQFTFIGFYIFFIINLLQVKNYDKLLVKVLKYLGLACFLYAITYFVFSQFFYDRELSGQVFAWIRLIILPLNFILIFWIIYKVKHPLLIYFIIGQSFFFIGALLASYIGYFGIQYDQNHIFGFKESPNIIFQIGLLLEVYCFSLALGKNVFILQKEKEKANADLIGQLQENHQLQKTMNDELDEKVNQKTEELIQLYSEIEKEKEQKIKEDFNQRIKEIETVALRSQMNPHFIFNSLSAIKNLIMTSRNDNAMTYLDDFSGLLRGILQNNNRKKITVEEELEIIKLYLSLEKGRMGTSFNYTIHVSSKEELSQYQIPPLLLQPLVENAIWHGLHPSLKANKELTIIFDTTESLKIIIEDNGIGRKESAKKEKLHKSMGTSIVKDRLALYNHVSDQTIRFKVTDLEKNGTVLGTRITLTY